MSYIERDPQLAIYGETDVTPPEMGEFYYSMMNPQNGWCSRLSEKAIEEEQILQTPELEMVKVVFVRPSLLIGQKFHNGRLDEPAFAVESARLAHTRLKMTHELFSGTTGLEMYTRDKKSGNKDKWGYLELGTDGDVRYNSSINPALRTPRRNVLRGYVKAMKTAANHTPLEQY